MKLKKALELRMEYGFVDESVRVDKNGYICINDLQRYFPKKRIDVWLKSQSTKELISCLDEDSNYHQKVEVKNK